jgi:diguanylate cyclase (GGDEF)-like protein/PAS domain S-box-containing protein
MTLRIKTILVIILLIICIASILWSTLAIDSRVKGVNLIWQSHNSQVLKKSEALDNIHKYFGYGGFIHHFKNLVLRLDVKYIELAERDINKTRNAIEVYRSLDNDEQELNSLRDFEIVVNEYDTKLQVAKERFKSGITQTELDELVKVDDAPAFKALTLLFESLARTSEKINPVVNQKLIETKSILNTFLFVFIPIIIVAGLIIIGYLRRITASLIENESIFLSTPDALLVSLPSGKIIKTNSSAQLMFGYSKKEFKELTIEDILPEQHREKHRQYRQQFSQKKQSSSMGVRPPFPALHKDGHTFQTTITITTFGLEKNFFTMAVVKDITEEINLKEVSTTDYLTKLPNRLRIDEFLMTEIERTKRYKRSFSIMICDIDFFKKINDTFGHQKGDQTLLQFAQFLSGRKRSTDFIGRWGGEEFVVICPETSIHDAAILGETLRSAVEEHLFSEDLKLTISIGIASFHIKDIDESASALLHRADAGLYKAKEAGRNCVKVEE